jgi:hypothetical protein
MYWKKNRLWLRVIGVNFALMIVIIILTELTFGSIFFGKNYGLLVVDRNVSRRFDTANRYGGGITEYIRDEHGLRGKYSEPSRIDILTMGGSTTNEILLNEGDTWSDRLAQEFADVDRSIVVVNAGVDGQSTIGHLKVFDLWFPKIPDFRPRYIIAYIGINDVSHILANKPLNKWEVMVEPNKRIKQYLMNNSVFYGLYRKVKGYLRARNAMLVHSTPGGPYEWKPTVLPPDVAAAEQKFAPFLDSYGTRVREIIRRIRSLHAKPIILTQHTGHYRLRGDRVFGHVAAERHESVWRNQTVEKGTVSIGPYEVLMAHNRRAMKICRESNAICIDVSKELAFEKDDHYDLIHTTPQGSAKLAKFIFERLKDKIE